MRELPTYTPDFEEYIRQGEPGKKERAQIWRTAIGLQQVDGLETSDYLKQTVRRNIEGEISIDEVQRLVKAYYVSKTNREPGDDDKEEADNATTNIGKILASRTFDFSTNGYVSLHKRIFAGVFKHAGHIRDYDITKKEFVLRGGTVYYMNWEDLRRALDYDINQEKQFSYKGLSQDEVIAHLAKFVADLWQIHAFCEGNTRTTAVFTIQYLRFLGYDVNNDMFAENSWYFRNALVRANYRNVAEGVDYSPIYLERFFRNLLLGENNVLRNRELHLDWKTPTSTPSSTPSSTPTSLEEKQKKTSIGKNMIETDNENVIRFMRALGHEQMSVKDLMAKVGLSDRKNFLEYSLNPAMDAGFVRMLYPESPKHPRQKYLLTVKGLCWYNNDLCK